MAEKRFSKGEAIRFGWKTMNDNVGFFVVFMLIFFGVTWIPSIIAELMKNTIPLLASLINISGTLLAIFITPGVIKIFLKFCDNEPARIEDLFAFPQLFLSYLGASILCGLAVVLGIICLIIPGLILMVKLQFFGYFIVDKNMSAIESLKKSYAMCKGLWGELVVFGLLLALINIAGALCLLIGLFATIPTTYLAVAYVYRKLSAENQQPAVATISV